MEKGSAVIPEQEGTVQVTWRKVSPLLFDVIHKHFNGKGILHARADFLRAMEEDPEEEVLPQAFGQSRSALLIQSINHFSRKIDRIAAMAMGLQPGHSGWAITPEPVDFDQDGIPLWGRMAEVEEGDLLEMDLAIFPESAFLVRCYGEVVRAEHGLEEAGMSRLACRFIPKFRPVSLAGVAESVAGAVAAAPAQGEPVKQEEGADGEEQAHVPAPHMRPRPPEGVNRAMPVEVVAETVGEKAGAVEDVRNRRQFFRLNDDMLLSWKIISQEEYSAIRTHFEAHGEFLERAKVRLFRQTLKDLTDRIANIDEKNNPKVVRALLWMVQRLRILFMRANLEEEENQFFELTSQLLGVVQTLLELKRIRPRVSRIFGGVRQKMELQQIRDFQDFRTDPMERERIRVNLRRVDEELQELCTGCDDDVDTGKDMAEALRRFRDGVGLISLRRMDPPGEKDDPDLGMITYQVNLSGNGLAFRTRKSGFEKGSLVEMVMGLVPQDGVLRPTRCYGKLVMVKGPSPDHRFRVASQTIMIQKVGWNLYYQHIVRKQRLTLANRVEVNVLGGVEKPDILR